MGVFIFQFVPGVLSSGASSIVGQQEPHPQHVDPPARLSECLDHGADHRPGAVDGRAARDPGTSRTTDHRVAAPASRRTGSPGRVLPRAGTRGGDRHRLLPRHDEPAQLLHPHLALPVTGALHGRRDPRRASESTWHSTRSTRSSPSSTPSSTGQRPPVLYVAWCAAWAVVALGLGTWVFLRKERDFALRL